MTMTTLESQLARQEAIMAAPEHKDHNVLQQRVDTWKDPETGAYVALISESLTQGETEESAIKAAESVIRIRAKMALGIPLEEPQ